MKKETIEHYRGMIQGVLEVADILAQADLGFRDVCGEAIDQIFAGMQVESRLQKEEEWFESLKSKIEEDPDLKVHHRGDEEDD